MMKFSKSFIAISFSLCLFFCVPQEIDYALLNKLIASKKYEQAIEKIEEYRGSTSNLLELQKLNQLYISADKSLLFKKVNTKLNNKDTINFKLEMDSIHQQILAKDSLSQRWYYFDFYWNQGKYFSLYGDSSKQIKNLLKAVEYPVREIQKKMNVFLDLAFHFAELNQFEKAREWLDKALRTFNKKDIKGQLLDVYMAYMNGKYAKADSILSVVPKENKNLNWQGVESFFNLHKDSLSLKNRFRLW